MFNKSHLISLFLLIFTWSEVSAQTLQEAIQQTITSHPEILQNFAQAAAAQQSIAEAEGAYYPSIDINAGYGREMTESPITQDLEGDSKITLNRREFSVALTQNIFAGGGIVGEVKRNLFSFQSQHFKTLGVANDLALTVTETYLNVILHKKLVLLAKKNLAVHKRLLNLIEERSEAGISRQAELDQAQSRLELAKANLITAESNYEEAKIRFKKYVGCWPENLVEPNIPDKDAIPPTADQAIHKGLQNHPFIHSAQADIKEARAQHQVAKAGFYPKIDGILSASRNRNLDGLEGRNNDNLAIIRGSYNAFRGGSDLANSRKTAFLVQEALEIRNNSIIDLKESYG